MLISRHMWNLGPFMYRCLLRLLSSHHCNKLIRVRNKMFMVGFTQDFWNTSGFRSQCSEFLLQYVYATWHSIQPNPIWVESMTSLVLFFSQGLNLWPYGQFIFLLVTDSMLILCACTQVLTETNLLGSFLGLIDMVKDEDDWFTVFTLQPP